MSIDKNVKKDREIERLSSLNEDIRIIDIENSKVKCQCLKCGNEWVVSKRSYVKTHSCPSCRVTYIPKSFKSYTTEEWIEKAKIIHPEYVYDEKTVYKNNHTPVTVKCKKHGYFRVQPKSFMKDDYFCIKCKKEKHLMDESKVIYEKMQEKNTHGYIYDMSEYKGISRKIRIKCPMHGWFEQTPSLHLDGRGCPICSKLKPTNCAFSSTEEFIKKAKEVRKDRNDDFSKVNYKTLRTYITLICNEVDGRGIPHGEYNITPEKYLSGGLCPKCAGREHLSMERFKEKASIIHGNKYDYSNIKEYNGIYDKIPIICHEKDEFGEEHGIFYQTAKHHLNGFGCKKCSKNYMDLDLFKKRSAKLHNNKYIYDKVTVYKNNHTKVDIICPEHGVFSQTPMCHLQGQGCPYCKESHLENTINNMLTEIGVNYEREKRFKWLVNDKTNYTLPLDFFVPLVNIAIECQGEQHYISNYYRSKGEENAENRLKSLQYRDGIKSKLCAEHGIKLIYFLDKKFIKYVDDSCLFFSDVKDISEYIKNKIEDETIE